MYHWIQLTSVDLEIRRKNQIEKVKLILIITIDKRHVFSRNAPTQPVNPIMNVIVPQHISTNAGSSKMLLLRDIFRNISFSFHA